VRLLPDFFTRNITLKLASLGLALLLWSVIRVEATTRQSIPSVPVRVELSDPTWTQSGDPLPATVELRVSGPARELLRLALDRPSIVIPIDQLSRGDTAVVINREWVRMVNRASIAVEDIQPSSVRLSFEPVATATVPVAVRLSGELPQGLFLPDRPGVEPPTVRAVGPAGGVAALDSALTRPLDLSAVQASGGYRVALDPSGLGLVRVSTDSVTIRLRVEPASELTASGVPVLILPELGLEGLEVSPGEIQVGIKGAAQTVEALDTGRLRGVVDAARVLGMEPGEERSIPLRVEGVPPGVQATPAPTTVVVRRVPE